MWINRITHQHIVGGQILIVTWLWIKDDATFPPFYFLYISIILCLDILPSSSRQEFLARPYGLEPHHCPTHYRLSE